MCIYNSLLSAFVTTVIGRSAAPSHMHLRLLDILTSQPCWAGSQDRPCMPATRQPGATLQYPQKYLQSYCDLYPYWLNSLYSAPPADPTD
jgi:hypothetical protein